MSSKTSNVYVVEEITVKGEKRELWTKIGSAFPHNDGRGHNIEIRKGIAVSGRIVVRDRKPEGADGED